MSLIQQPTLPLTHGGVYNGVVEHSAAGAVVVNNNHHHHVVLKRKYDATTTSCCFSSTKTPTLPTSSYGYHHHHQQQHDSTTTTTIDGTSISSANNNHNAIIVQQQQQQQPVACGAPQSTAPKAGGGMTYYYHVQDCHYNCHSPVYFVEQQLHRYYHQYNNNTPSWCHPEIVVSHSSKKRRTSLVEATKTESTTSAVGTSSTTLPPAVAPAQAKKCVRFVESSDNQHIDSDVTLDDLRKTWYEEQDYDSFRMDSEDTIKEVVSLVQKQRNQNQQKQQQEAVDDTTTTKTDNKNATTASSSASAPKVPTLNTKQYCVRGLESSLSSTLRNARVQTVKLIVQSILKQQQQQRERGVHNPTFLKDVSKVVSQKSCQHAYQLAIKDAAEAAAGAVDAH